MTHRPIPLSTWLLSGLLLTGLLALGTATAAAEDSGYGKQKVVYHVNYYSPKEQTAALRNVQNHINAVGAENLELRVVLHGNGVAMLMYPDSLEGTKMKEANANDEMQARIAGLKRTGRQLQGLRQYPQGPQRAHGRPLRHRPGRHRPQRRCRAGKAARRGLYLH